jgi:hypothetical protein
MEIGTALSLHTEFRVITIHQREYQICEMIAVTVNRGVIRVQFNVVEVSWRCFHCQGGTVSQATRQATFACNMYN